MRTIHPVAVPQPGNHGRRAVAFTLVELLVVIVILGILAAVGVPAMRGFGEANAMAAANRQLLDDIGYARQRAMSGRTTVFMVFVPPGIHLQSGWSRLNNLEQKSAVPLLAGQYTMYSLFTFRQVGEQPGRQNPRYLTEWRSLPDKVFIAPEKFTAPAQPVVKPFYKLDFPFPNPTSTNRFTLPYIAFDYQGRLTYWNSSANAFLSSEDEVIPLTRGSIFYARDSAGTPIAGPADVLETPPGNWTNNFNRVQIDWLTGRARIERPEIQ